MTTENSAETKTYTGRCHCNSTIFEVTIPPLETGATKVNQCNCSICTKSGYMLVYPDRKDVKFLRGWDELKSYKFGRKIKPHRFCGECGTSILIDFGEIPEVEKKRDGDVLAVSVRTFDGIEDIMDKIQWTSWDGKRRMEPFYKPLAEKQSAETKDS